jgi:adenylyl-sulfate kinase
LTGLPGAGKSTLARLLAVELRQLGLAVEILDGDEIRKHLTRDLGFSKEDRLENVRRIVYVAKLLARIGGVVIVAAIAPYAAAREAARAEIDSFVEVFVRCPLEVCVKRDVKGLYAKAYRGEIAHMTGVSAPYEAPVNPEVIVDTDRELPDQSLKKILHQLQVMNLIP